MSSRRIVLVLVVFFLTVSLWWINQSPTSTVTEKITIAALPLPGAGLFFIAEEKGYFRSNGLDVTLQMHPTGKLALDALFKGSADYAAAADIPLLFAIESGNKPAILATIYHPNGGIAVIAKKDKVATPADLKGKRLGTTFISSGQFVADMFLLVNGIDPAHVELVNVGPNEIAEALKTNKIDAACTWQPYLALLEDALGENGVTFSNKGLYTFRLNLVTSQNNAAKHQAQLRKLIASLQQAQRYLLEDPATAMSIVSQRTGSSTATYSKFFEPFEYELQLEQGLLLAMEDQTRWAIKHGFVKAQKVPNYLEYLSIDALQSVNPTAVRLIH